MPFTLNTSQYIWLDIIFSGKDPHMKAELRHEHASGELTET